MQFCVPVAPDPGDASAVEERGCVLQDELLVVKDKMVMEIVDLIKWVATDDDDDDGGGGGCDEDALNQLLSSRLHSTDDKHGLCITMYTHTSVARWCNG